MTEADVDALAIAFQNCTLPKSQWTHHAHLAVGLWHLRRFGKDVALSKLRNGIRKLNSSHGTPNSETRGYHETITRLYVQLLDEFLYRLPAETPLDDALRRLYASRLAAREFLFGFYSSARLMSPQARADWLEPDLAEVRLPRPSISKSGDRRRSTWKNGEGWSEEIAVFPTGATLDNFDWRVSLAGTGASSAFSLFPGIDRTLVILHGRLSLVIDGATPVKLAKSSPPLFFSGDLPAFGTLEEGPLTDLNVMTRRGRFTHRVELQRLEPATILPLSGGATLVIDLDTFDVWLFEQPCGPETHPLDGGRCCIIRIDPAS